MWRRSGKSFFFIDSFQSKLIKYYNAEEISIFFVCLEEGKENKRERETSTSRPRQTNTMIIISDFHKLPETIGFVKCDFLKDNERFFLICWKFLR